MLTTLDLIAILTAGGATVTVLRAGKRGAVLKVEKAGLTTTYVRTKTTSIRS